MGEIPQEIPIEEQVKQDPKFAHLLKSNPEYCEKIVKLSEKKQQDSSDRHANFWLDYLSKYNTLVGGFCDVLDKNDPEQQQSHSEAVVEWLNDFVQVAIDSTSTSIFETNRTANGWTRRIAMFENNPEEVDQHAGIIMQTPIELASLT